MSTRSTLLPGEHEDKRCMPCRCDAGEVQEGGLVNCPSEKVQGDGGQPLQKATTIRPILLEEANSVVFHSMLTKAKAAELEDLQRLSVGLVTEPQTGREIMQERNIARL